ncbi:MAG: ATP-binding protein [Eubacteriales bacterium]
MLKKLQIFLVLIVLLSISTTGIFCIYFLSQYSDRMNEQLLESASELFVRDIADGRSYEEASASCQAVFADESTQLRITVIAADGTVLYDNQQAAASMENHANRNEVKAVLSSKGTATVKRHSATLDVDMLYMARYYAGLDQVIRTSIPLVLYQTGVKQLQTAFIAVMAGTLILLAGVSYIFTKRLTRPLFELRNAAKSMAAANYSVRVHAGSHDEIGALSVAFNSMAEQLEKEVHELEEKNERLAELQQMRSEFVANVSHELKTPLTSIRGFVDTLRNGKIEDPAVQGRFLEIIDIEAERLHQLISDILQLSEIEGMKNDQELQKFDLSALLDDVATLLDDKASERHVQIVVEDSEVLPVLASQYRIKQILINLVDNAIKYNKPGGRVYIRATREPDQIVAIRVRDTGDGIPAEHLARVFERFYRVDKSHSREMGGTGLGLSIVKHIAQLYEGTATVESIEGEGSTFTVRLRIADDLN